MRIATRNISRPHMTAAVPGVPGVPAGAVAPHAELWRALGGSKVCAGSRYLR
jgi:hypothetical protein